MSVPGTSAPRRPRRWIGVLLAVALLASGGAGLALGLSRPDPPVVAASRPWFSDQVTATADQTLQQLALGQAQSSLNAEARRIRHGHEPATQGVPFDQYRIRLGSAASPTPADLLAGRFRAIVMIRYRLPIDHVTVARSVQARFTLGRHGWQLAHIGANSHDLWAHGPVDVASSGRTLVMGSASYSSRLPSLATQADAARRQVAGLWTAKWPGRVVVLLPQDARTMNPLVGTASVSRVPAVTNVVSGSTGPIIRITLNPEVFLSLPALSQQIVLRHEITHVAQDALAAGHAPVWLTEGLAEYFGYLGTGIPDSVVGAGVFDQVRASGVPHALPADDAFAFDLSSDQRSLVYEQGWAACRMVADRYGQARLVPFYVAAVNANGSPQERVDQAARKVLGINGRTFVAQWQQWLQDHA